MSKRPISYTVPTTPERPSKRRQVSSATFSGSYQQTPEPMDVDEVTSTLKRKIGNPPQNRGSNKYLAPTTWAMQVDDLEPDSGDFVHPYVEPRGEKRKATEYSPAGSILNPTRGERPSKRFLPMSWAERVQDLGISEPDSGDFVHPNLYQAPVEVPTPPSATPMPPSQKREVIVGIRDPSTAGFIISPNYNKMATTIYKYLHVDSTNRLTHENNAKLTVNFGGLPIENIKRVGILKATITNTNMNIYEGNDEVKIAVRLASGTTYVTLTIGHAYYTLTELLAALNAKLQEYTNGTPAVQTAVRDLEFDETTDEQVRIKVKNNPGTTADTDVSYALIADHLSHTANTLWYELGFDKTKQTLHQTRYDDYLAGNLHDTTHYGQLILPSQNFSGRIFYQPNTGDNRPTQLFAFHKYVIENASGFNICSQALTSGGNVLKAQVIGNGQASVQHDDILVSISNKALRDEFNHYEASVIEWQNVYGDLNSFDLEIKSHGGKSFTSSVGSASPPFKCVFIFECETRPNVFGADSLRYTQEAFNEAHRQT
jgi:hypothetical protein